MEQTNSIKNLINILYRDCNIDNLVIENYCVHKSYNSNTQFLSLLYKNLKDTQARKSKPTIEDLVILEILDKIKNGQIAISELNPLLSEFKQDAQ